MRPSGRSSRIGVIVDSSGLVALLDRHEPDHDRCLAVVAEHGGPLLTTWPAFTEAMYLLHRNAGWAGVDALWRINAAGHLAITEQTEADQARMYELMRSFRDMPMALADASLVTLAEQLRETRVISLDRHFHSYVVTWGRGRHGFELLP